MKLKKGDNVMVIAGKDRGKTWKIEKVYNKIDKISVSGINVLKKHTKPRGKVKQAGIIEFAAPMPTSKVMLVCPKCNRAIRIAKRLVRGTRERVCRKCKEAID